MAALALYLFHLNGIAGDPYKTLELALTGTMPVVFMAIFCLLKLGATVSSYSSGGSGGIFAPSLFMGAMLGGVVGFIDVSVFHHPKRRDWSLRGRRHGRGVCRHRSRTDDVNPDCLRDDGRLRAGAAADDRQHDAPSLWRGTGVPSRFTKRC